MLGLCVAGGTSVLHLSARRGRHPVQRHPSCAADTQLTPAGCVSYDHPAVNDHHSAATPEQRSHQSFTGHRALRLWTSFSGCGAALMDAQGAARHLEAAGGFGHNPGICGSIDWRFADCSAIYDVQVVCCGC
ncbi:hypothetical protein WJX72_003970 [[Myrmecia] bisecta]|uniref:Uncharacterized protein n=1 Tax=[Myrmecia] bisecta TaxID=41462 RepID=A0AAW1Q4X0_9CHLO